MKYPAVPLILGIVTIAIIAWAVWIMQNLPPLGARLPVDMMPLMYKLFSKQPMVLLAVPVLLTAIAFFILKAWPKGPPCITSSLWSQCFISASSPCRFLPL